MYIFVILLSLILIFVLVNLIKKTQKCDEKYKSIANYSVKEFANFLTDSECDTLISISSPKLFDSKVYSNGSDDVDKKNRISQQCWLQDSEDKIVESISKKVAEITGTPQQNQEHLQVVKYKPGGFFKHHYDACDGDKSFCKRMNGKSGPRLATLIIYLNDDFQGGETFFPNIDYNVAPKKGKAVLFYNIDNKTEKIIKESLHAGKPVKSGEKWICNKWVRTKKFVV